MANEDNDVQERIIDDAAIARSLQAEFDNEQRATADRSEAASIALARHLAGVVADEPDHQSAAAAATSSKRPVAVGDIESDGEDENDVGYKGHKAEDPPFSPNAGSRLSPRDDLTTTTTRYADRPRRQCTLKQKRDGRVVLDTKRPAAAPKGTRSSPITLDDSADGKAGDASQLSHHDRIREELGCSHYEAATRVKLEESVERNQLSVEDMQSLICGILDQEIIRGIDCGRSRRWNIMDKVTHIEAVKSSQDDSFQYRLCVPLPDHFAFQDGDHGWGCG